MKNNTLERRGNDRARIVLPPDTAAAVRELLAEAASANTDRSYRSALRYWALWHQARYGAPLVPPLLPAVVVQFIVDHAQRRTNDGLRHDLPRDVDDALVQARAKTRVGPLKLSTVQHRVAVLSKAHQARRVANPCVDPAVRALLAKARRAAWKRGERPRKKKAATRDVVEALIATCDASLAGVRDRAIILFGFATGGRRRSEIADAQVEDLERLPDGGFVFRLPQSKTRQAGDAGADKPVLGRAAAALSAWLEAGKVTTGPLFRRLWRERVGERRLSGAAIAAMLQRRVALAGLSGDFAGHSLRSGFVTEAGRRGKPLAAVMALTEHRSVKTVMGYFQSGEARSNAAARLMDE